MAIRKETDRERVNYNDRLLPLEVTDEREWAWHSLRCASINWRLCDDLCHHFVTLSIIITSIASISSSVATSSCHFKRAGLLSQVVWLTTNCVAYATTTMHIITTAL